MSDSIHGNDPYRLLRNYGYESRVLSLAFSYQEKYYRRVDRCLTYPLVVLSAFAGVMSGLDMNQYIVMAINLSSVILIGFNQIIAPKDKQFAAHNVSNEFSEIGQSISQFIGENSKSRIEIKHYSQICCDQLKVWKSLSPSIKDSYITAAKAKLVLRVRPYSIPRLSDSKKELQNEKKEVPVTTVLDILKLHTTDDI